MKTNYLQLTAGLVAGSALSALLSTSLASTQPGASMTINHWVDPGTGCHYLLTGAGVLTPRLHSDGTQVCDYSEDGWPLDRNITDGLSYGEDGEELLPPAEPYPPTPKTMTAVSPALTIKVVL